ncbi:glucosamine-6-phosphate deaminase [Streptococcus moroccensis]|uniref:Glucosamine-6-phosphate deaminase n=1 Tax=Streptococcus moroccensis TaxID=1451356 RepID=A0ABT9YRG0_9STRE|nr:glucosamine-6-phosphate deaminase [Streptococcus moroccensis]MDQ0222186.1 glucosamine-6-phosphate deaminase [Streptococcus moroccensis]
MKIIEVQDQIEGGKIALDIVRESLTNGAKVFGLATGSTPIELYKQAVASDIDFSNAVAINLDEYVGLGPDDDQSYRYFMQKHLFEAKPFKETYVPDGKAQDLNEAAEAYEVIIQNNPIDLQILGIGRNGHIGFNEPGTPFDQQTHVVDLVPSTIEANARFFDNPEDVPRQAVSMGIASIMKAKAIVLMAYGSEKAEAIAGLLEGPVTEDLPASILQRHPDVTIIADEAALSLYKGE